MHQSAESYAKTFFKDLTQEICFTFKHLVNCIYSYKNLFDKKLSLFSEKVYKKKIL